MAATLVVVLLSARPAAPADLASWVGTWFKLRGRTRGVVVEATGFRSRGTRFTAYLHLWDTDHTGYFDVDLYEEGSGGWKGYTSGMSYTDAGPDDFVFLAQLGDASHASFLVGRVRAVGSRATLHSFGGVVFDRAQGTGPPTYGGGLVLSGRRVPEAAVPVPVGSRLH